MVVVVAVVSVTVVVVLVVVVVVVVVVAVATVMVEEETQRCQQHRKIDYRRYNLLQRIFCFERMLMQVQHEVERD
jgi:hypothetical protein